MGERAVYMSMGGRKKYLNTAVNFPKYDFKELICTSKRSSNELQVREMVQSLWQCGSFLQS